MRAVGQQRAGAAVRHRHDHVPGPQRIAARQAHREAIVVGHDRGRRGSQPHVDPGPGQRLTAGDVVDPGQRDDRVADVARVGLFQQAEPEDERRLGQ